VIDAILDSPAAMWWWFGGCVVVEIALGWAGCRGWFDKCSTSSSASTNSPADSKVAAIGTVSSGAAAATTKSASLATLASDAGVQSATRRS
jgi:hypothetical protein